MDMIFLIIHSLLRWAVLLTACWAVISAVKGIISKCPYSTNDNRSSLLFMISCDIQLVIGLFLYFSEGWGSRLIHWNIGDKATRFFTVEHAGTMLLAWVIVHIGRTVVKKAKSDRDKHRKALIYFGVALILILVAIPWPFRTALGPHPWFRI
ncbi:MAG TPA: hypothetical protein VNE41_12190 [Chitinophagaceae bacterium]|nr:hypothetical protein [Chitinophagaceae bacterium]